MEEKAGEVFSIAKDNMPVPGCTISKEVHGGENGIIYFSLAKNTDISAEIFPYHKLLIVAEGSLEYIRQSTNFETVKYRVSEKSNPFAAKHRNLCFSKKFKYCLKVSLCRLYLQPHIIKDSL